MSVTISGVSRAVRDPDFVMLPITKKQAKNNIDIIPNITMIFFDRIIFHVNMFLKKL
jgi:hypothetical protein